LSDDTIRQAVRGLSNQTVSRDEICGFLAVVLSHRDAARPLLLNEFSQADGSARLMYAKVLGVLGERQAAGVLIEELRSTTAWDEKILQGRMAEYAHLPTPIDALILALGHTGHPQATDAILEKLETLDAKVTLSHHRAVALALEKLADPAAAEPLARLLQKPGMRGHAMPTLEPLYNSERDRRRREGPLREIVLARALYRCGDNEQLGETILQEYARDLRGLFARHAKNVLETETP
jgi:HEAT repeat protein